VEWVEVQRKFEAGHAILGYGYLEKVFVLKNSGGACI
jgi:hypothetical protein